MKKKAYIIVNGYYFPQKLERQTAAYIEAFRARGVELEVLRSSEILAHIDGRGIESSLADAEFVLFLDKDIHLAKMLETKFRLYNCARAVELCDDKALTHIELAGKVNMPLTITSPLNYSQSGDEDFIRAAEAKLSYPIVVKEVYGSYGKQVYLAENYAELRMLWQSLRHKPHIYQEFIVSSSGTDIRITLVGGRAVAAIKRTAKEGFRSNLELGGTAERFDAPKEYIEMAEKASKILRLDFCGMDILIGKNGEPIFCEANSNAFFKTSEELCGADITGMIVDHIMSGKAM